MYSYECVLVSISLCTHIYYRLFLFLPQPRLCLPQLSLLLLILGLLLFQELLISERVCALGDASFALTLFLPPPRCLLNAQLLGALPRQTFLALSLPEFHLQLLLLLQATLPPQLLCRRLSAKRRCASSDSAAFSICSSASRIKVSCRLRAASSAFFFLNSQKSAARAHALQKLTG